MCWLTNPITHEECSIGPIMCPLYLRFVKYVCCFWGRSCVPSGIDASFAGMKAISGISLCSPCTFSIVWCTKMKKFIKIIHLQFLYLFYNTGKNSMHCGDFTWHWKDSNTIMALDNTVAINGRLHFQLYINSLMWICSDISTKFDLGWNQLNHITPQVQISLVAIRCYVFYFSLGFSKQC